MVMVLGFGIGIGQPSSCLLACKRESGWTVGEAHGPGAGDQVFPFYIGYTGWQSPYHLPFGPCDGQPPWRPVRFRDGPFSRTSRFSHAMALAIVPELHSHPLHTLRPGGDRRRQSCRRRNGLLSVVPSSSVLRYTCRYPSQSLRGERRCIAFGRRRSAAHVLRQQPRGHRKPARHRGSGACRIPCAI